MYVLFSKLPRICKLSKNGGLPNSMLTRMRSSTYYDVIISGGGVVGSSMACALGASPYFSGKNLLILESQPQRPIKKLTPTEPFSNRVTAISPGSRRFMEHLGIWDRIERKCAVKKMQIWDALSNSSISFVEDDMSGDLCYIIENDLMVSSMHELMDKMTSDNFRTVYGSRISALNLPKDYGNAENEPVKNAEITLTSGENLECGLLIAADGANSSIPAKANIPKLSTNYEQAAVVATLKLDKPSENVVAWQRFLPEDPKIDQLQFPPRIAEVCGKPASFPLGVSHSNYYVKPRLALIGDTAHRIHPLAGQGANLGFRDVLCLLQRLEQAVQRGSDLGCMSHLIQFERERQLDNVAFCIATDGINRLYSTVSKPAVLIRSLGLKGVAATDPLKEFLKRRAML